MDVIGTLKAIVANPQAQTFNHTQIDNLITTQEVI